MRTLSKEEINHLIARSRKLPLKESNILLDEFKKKQPDLFGLIYGQPREAIAQISPDMATKYLDLCFEILFVYTESFGKPPKSKRGAKWIGDAFQLIYTEIQALFPEIPMDEQLRKRLHDRFIRRSLEGGVQMELLSYLQDTLENYTSLNQEREPAFNTTNSCLFVFLRLMDELYNRKKK